MKAEKALELVNSYAKISRGIRTATKAMLPHLDQCRGFSGKRRAFDPFAEPGEIDEKGREKDVHLNDWYKMVPSDSGYSGQWQAIGEGHKEECPHCYAAHLLIEDRKALRKELAGVRRSMSNAKP